MFGRKKGEDTTRQKAPAAPQRILISAEGGPLYDGPLTALSVPEALIIELSIEFFDDPEPCQIHRSAVLKRVFMELTLTLGEESTTQRADLPPQLIRYLAAYPKLSSVTLYRGEAQ